MVDLLFLCSGSAVDVVLYDDNSQLCCNDRAALSYEPEMRLRPHAISE